MIKNLSLTLMFCLLGLIAYTQEMTIQGLVLDPATGEGVPFCNVYIKNTTIGVSTDIDGYYKLITKTQGDTLVVSAIGYVNQAKQLGKEPEQTIDFYIKSSDMVLEEVVVYAGENPANEIVRRIIKNKEQNRIDKIEAFRRETYTKMELDLKNISDKMQRRKLFKPFAFVFENIDSTSEEQPFLPAYMSEVIADAYHRKGDKVPVEIPKAQRVSGITNQSINEFISSIHEPYNIYNNWIYLLDRPFASPFSNQGLFYYKYYIIDSTHIDGQWCYKLKFKPKRKQESTFYGYFWVADTTYAITRLDMKISKDANINLVDRVDIFQEYRYQEAHWLPQKERMIIDFVVTKKSPGVIARKSVSHKNYNLDTEYVKPEKPEYIVQRTLEKDEEFWAKARHDELSEQEAKVYEMVDSIKNVPAFKTYADALYLLSTGYKEFGKIELGNVYSLYGINRVEGHRLQFSARTSDEFSKRVRLGGFLAYGFKDNRIKYGGRAVWMLRKEPRTFIGASYRLNVEFNSRSSELDLERGLLAGAYRRPIEQKMLFLKEFKVFGERYWKKGWSNRLILMHREMDPYGFGQGGGFNYKYLPDPESPSRVDTTVETTELIFKTRYAFGEKFIDGDFFRQSLGTKHPVIEFQYVAGIGNWLAGGNPSYHQLGLSIRHYFYINPIGWLSYRINAGKYFGQLPYLLSEVYPGNETYFYIKNVFSGMNRFEFASDAYVSIILDHHFEGFFLNKIPLMRKLKLREVVSFKAAYGTMTEKNKQSNRLNAFDPNREGYTGFRVPDKKPYMEASAGIENIFKIIRIEALWRLTYLDNPEAPRFGIRGGIDFYF